MNLNWLKFTSILLLYFFAISTQVFAQTDEWKYMHKGNRAFEAQDYDEAGLCYLNAIQENSTSSRALFNLGDVQLAKNNPQAAYDYFEKSIKLEKDTLVKAMAYHNQGYIYHASAMSSTKEDEWM